MYDEKLVRDFLPTVYKLAQRYENEYVDVDELYSEGLLVMTEYLKFNKRKKNNPSDIKQGLYYVVRRRLDKLSHSMDDNRCDVDIDLCYSNIIYINLQGLYDILSKALTSREHDIINRIYGIYGKSETYQQIANDYDLTCERVRQISREALHKIKIHLNSNNIHSIIDFSERI